MSVSFYSILKKTALFILVINCFLYSQEKLVPPDTSFALYTTSVKISKDYPNSKLVVSEIPYGVIERKNEVYASYGKRKMYLDLYTPPGTKNIVEKQVLYPAVLMIHGGGWRSGFRQMERPMALYLASHGYVTATVEYRLSGEAKYPASVIDLRSAIKWLRKNAKKYNIDINKIASYGCSSGGQLAALLGTNNWTMKYQKRTIKFNHLEKIQCVIDIDGVLDMTDPNESGKDKDSLKPSSGKLWFGFSYNERPDLWKEASAINYISGESATYCFINSSLPRFHAGRDSVINMLNNYKIYSEVHTIPGTPHPFWLFHPWFDETCNYILNFLNKIFKENN
jgi:pectinesterase